MDAMNKRFVLTATERSELVKSLQYLACSSSTQQIEQIHRIVELELLSILPALDLFE